MSSDFAYTLPFTTGEEEGSNLIPSQMPQQQRVLNPYLYNRLLQLFGSVKIANQGQQFKYSGVKSIIDNKITLNIIQKGEYYRVCCPFCGDTRFRLYIHHMFGKEIQVFNEKLKLTFLAICFNETNCLDDPMNRKDLYDLIYSNQNQKLVKVPHHHQHLHSHNVSNLSGKSIKIKLPGDCFPLTQLPDDHPCITYLKERGFDDINYLVKNYKLCYCARSRNYLAENRLIIPVYEKDKLLGWQARYIGELDWKNSTIIKYYSCPGMPRSYILYNLDRAVSYPALVIVEGPFDVWRVGPMAICTFGSTMSDIQKRRLVALGQNKKIILLYDGDVAESPKIVDLVFHFKRSIPPGNFFFIKLPRDKDPADLSTEYLHNLLYSHTGIDFSSLQS